MSKILGWHLKILNVERMMGTAIDDELHWLAFAFPSATSGPNDIKPPFATQSGEGKIAGLLPWFTIWMTSAM
jgi:hypothetical protein